VSAAITLKSPRSEDRLDRGAHRGPHPLEQQARVRRAFVDLGLPQRLSDDLSHAPRGQLLLARDLREGA
jgi:hypothetical protein